MVVWTVRFDMMGGDREGFGLVVWGELKVEVRKGRLYGLVEFIAGCSVISPCLVWLPPSLARSET